MSIKIKTRNWRLSDHTFKGVFFNHIEWGDSKYHRDATSSYRDAIEADLEKGLSEIKHQIRREGYVYGIKC